VKRTPSSQRAPAYMCGLGGALNCYQQPRTIMHFRSAHLCACALRNELSRIDNGALRRTSSVELKKTHRLHRDLKRDNIKELTVLPAIRMHVKLCSPRALHYSLTRQHTSIRQEVLGREREVENRRVDESEKSWEIESHCIVGREKEHLL
jgi:hypothetical protein